MKSYSYLDVNTSGCLTWEGDDIGGSGCSDLNGRGWHSVVMLRRLGKWPA